MLRQFFVMLLVSVMGFSAAIEHAEARRLGGGSSMGSVSRSADRPASTPAQQQAQGTQQQGAGAATARRGGMGGMMGGLLAGGLLAALFFGGAFDELRIMDLLLMAGIAALAIFAFRAFIRQRRPAPANAAGYQRERQETQHTPASNFTAAPGSLASGLQSTPDWFDKERFLGGAKEHFMTLFKFTKGPTTLRQPSTVIVTIFSGNLEAAMPAQLQTIPAAIVRPLRRDL